MFRFWLQLAVFVFSNARAPADVLENDGKFRSMRETDAEANYDDHGCCLGSKYRVVTVISPPFVMRRPVGGRTEYYGYCIDLINKISVLLNFTYEIYESPDGKFGAVDATGNWNGMVQELIQKNRDVAPRELSGRILVGSWWLFSFILMESYYANLTAIITTEYIDNGIRSLQDLSDQNVVDYGPLSESSAMKYFERMANIEAHFFTIWKSLALNNATSEEKNLLKIWNQPINNMYSKMWKQIKNTPLPKTLEEVKQRVAERDKKGFAFIGDAIEVRYVSFDECQFHFFKINNAKRLYSIGLQSRSILKSAFNKAILNLESKQILKTLKENWLEPKNRRRCDKNEKMIIEVKDIGGLFIIVFIGLILALLILIFEHYSKFSHENKKTKEIRKITSLLRKQ